MNLKLLIVQACTRGPWRWVIVDGQTTLAVSPVEYRKAGMARIAANKFCLTVHNLKRDGRLIAELRPSQQLSLFPVEV